MSSRLHAEEFFSHKSSSIIQTTKTCLTQTSGFSNTLLYQNERRFFFFFSFFPCLILLEFCYYSPPFCKNHTKLGVDKEFKHVRYFKQRLCIFFVQMLKTVSIFILRGWFQIYSGNNTLYAYEVINLVSKSVHSQYIQVWVKGF